MSRIKHNYRQALKERARREIQEAGSMTAAAAKYNVAPAAFTRVLKYNEDSPQLRRRFEIPKTARKRLTVEADQELIELFDRLRGSRSRRELLEDLLEAEEKRQWALDWHIRLKDALT